MGKNQKNHPVHTHQRIQPPISRKSSPAVRRFNHRRSVEAAKADGGFSTQDLQRMVNHRRLVEAKANGGFTQDVDSFFQSYGPLSDILWQIRLEGTICLTLFPGMGATLRLTDDGCRLILTNDNVHSLSKVWEILVQMTPSVKLLHQSHRCSRRYFPLSEDNLRLLMKTMGTFRLAPRSFYSYLPDKDGVVDLRDFFGQPSDDAYSELGIVVQAYSLQRIYFEVGTTGGQCWWQSVESVLLFCDRVLGAAKAAAAEVNHAAGFVFTYSDVIALEDRSCWCTAQQHLLGWFEIHQPGVPVLLDFISSYDDATEATRIFSGCQLAYYLQCVPFKYDAGMSYRESIPYYRCFCHENPYRYFLMSFCDMSDTLSLRRFGLQDDDMEWICRGLASRRDGVGLRRCRLLLTDNPGITEHGWWTLLCCAVSARTTVEFVVASSPGADYQRYFNSVADANRYHGWLMDALLLLYPDAQELTSLLFPVSGGSSSRRRSGKWYEKTDTIVDVLYVALRHDPGRWAGAASRTRAQKRKGPNETDR